MLQLLFDRWSWLRRRRRAVVLSRCDARTGLATSKRTLPCPSRAMCIAATALSLSSAREVSFARHYASQRRQLFCCVVQQRVEVASRMSAQRPHNVFSWLRRMDRARATSNRHYATAHYARSAATARSTSRARDLQVMLRNAEHACIAVHSSDSRLGLARFFGRGDDFRHVVHRLRYRLNIGQSYNASPAITRRDEFIIDHPG